MNVKKTSLGRGLSALMADIDAPAPKNKPKNKTDKAIPQTDKNQPTLVPIEKIKPNPAQPRRDFPKDALAELASSITAHGIIQPILVRVQKGGYQIIAGERRWRAAQAAKLHEIPVLIRDYSDGERLQISIIENIQRADLNAVEEATAYQSLMQKFGHTQEQLSLALGKSRPYLANSLRLLSLPSDVLAHLSTGRLSVGHARLLVNHKQASALAKAAVKDNFSVRQLEDLLKKDAPSKAKIKQNLSRTKKPRDTIELEQKISANLGFPVQIQHNVGGHRGLVILAYKNLEELDDLSQRLMNPEISAPPNREPKPKKPKPRPSIKTL